MLLEHSFFPASVYQFGESLPGNCSAGQLTTIGFNQQIQNGASLRKAYVDTGFLPVNFDGDEIYLRSDGKYADWVNVSQSSTNVFTI